MIINNKNDNDGDGDNYYNNDDNDNNTSTENNSTPQPTATTEKTIHIKKYFFFTLGVIHALFFALFANICELTFPFCPKVKRKYQSLILYTKNSKENIKIKAFKQGLVRYQNNIVFQHKYCDYADYIEFNFTYLFTHNTTCPFNL